MQTAVKEFHLHTHTHTRKNGLDKRTRSIIKNILYNHRILVDTIIKVNSMNLEIFFPLPETSLNEFLLLYFCVCVCGRQNNGYDNKTREKHQPDFRAN